MKKRFSTAIIAAAVTGAVFTAPVRSAAQSSQSFDEFRRGMLSNFSKFRENILKDYDKFLENAWVEYDRFRGEERDVTPKPSEPPVFIDPAVDPVVPAESVVKPEPQPEPIVEPVHEVEAEEIPVLQDDDTELPMLTGSYPRLSSPKEFASMWRTLDADPSVSAIARSLAAEAKKLNYNDYLTFDLVRSYVEKSLPSNHSSARAAIVHYLLTHMGYDARLGQASNGQGILLIPFRQMVYGRPYMRINDVRYYIFTDTDEDFDTSVAITTCKLPDGATAGNALDLLFASAPLIPYKPHAFHLSFGGLELSGEVNANIFPVIYRYPQMEVADYARSVIDPDVRKSLVEQVRAQLADSSRLDAVNTLLHFTQSAFKYATDEQAHGFEKPYFLEEMLYYPVCDCEDRSIFYTYLLWNALGVECQLINYPGHESVAIDLGEPLTGDSYTHNGKTYYISDPTYIGASTGQSMPDFRNLRPDVDLTYGK